MDEIHLGNAFGFTPSAKNCVIQKPAEPILIDSRNEHLNFSLPQLNCCVKKLCRQLVVVLTELKQHESIQGTSIALVSRNTAEYIVMFLAVAGLSCANALINPKFKESEFVHAMEDMKCDIALLESEGHGEAEAAAKKLKIPVFKFLWDFETSLPTPHLVTDTGCRVLPAPDVDRFLKPRGSDVCLKLHTSGTTSHPKIVPITHINCCVTMGNIAKTYKWDPQTDRGLLIMPLFHVHGLFAGCLSPLSRGSQVVLPQGYGFHKTTFCEDVEKYQITWATAVPSMWQILLASRSLFPERRFSSLRFIRGCSSALPPPIAELLELEFNTEVLEAYAMTEATHQMCSNPLGRRRKVGSVGLPTGIDCAIIESGRILPRGEIGEICVRGFNVIERYQNLNEEDQRKHFWSADQVSMGREARHSFFSSSLAIDLQATDYTAAMKEYYDERVSFPRELDPAKSAVKDKRFLRTGDLGFMDEDYFVHIIGRSKEVINRGGEKISPTEVDAQFLRFPEIAEACSFGVADSILGETVAMCVVLQPGVEPSEGLFARLRQESKSRLAAFKIPARIYVCDSLPKGATGKIQRREVAFTFADKRENVF